MNPENHDSSEIHAQRNYDVWITDSQAEGCERYNAPGLQPAEKMLLDELKPGTLVDIGCGTGERIFPFYKRSGIHFVGVEKFPQFKEASPYGNDILIDDIGADTLSATLQSRFGQFDVATMWGGTFCGIHTEKARLKAFENIASLLKKGGHLIMDTLRIPEIDFDRGPHGSRKKIFPPLPLQYFCTLPELTALAAHSGFMLLPGLIRNTQFPHGPQVEYLVFQKTDAC